MNIVELTAENVKKLKIVCIRPDGALVQVTGPNGSGKSTVLDCIAWALGGAALAQPVPIRRGQTSAYIKLNLGSLVVTRKFTEGKMTTLTVESPDGAKFPTPQKLLDSLVGELSFDPLEFTRLKPREQFDALLRLTDLAPHLANLDALSAADFEKRTAVNRRREDKEAQARGIAVPEGLPEVAPDVDAVMREFTAAGEANAELERRRARRAADDQTAENWGRQAKAAAEDVKKLNEESVELHARFQRELLALTERIALSEETERVCYEKYSSMKDKLKTAEPLPEPADLTALQTAATVAMRVVDAVKLRDRRLAVMEEAEALQHQSYLLTQGLDARKEEKRRMLTAAQLPVPDLGLADGLVTLNGLPLEQASDAEQLRASCAVAMAANPKLRVLRVKEGSLLDSAGLKLLGELAAAGGYQVWVERVADPGTGVGVVLEDGEVAS